MPFVEWKPEFSVGIERFDDDHRRLFLLLNQVHMSMSGTVSILALRFILGDLVWYTQTHFRAEEVLMKRCGYPDLAAHRAEHNRFTERVVQRYPERLRPSILEESRTGRTLSTRRFPTGEEFRPAPDARPPNDTRLRGWGCGVTQGRRTQGCLIRQRPSMNPGSTPGFSAILPPPCTPSHKHPSPAYPDSAPVRARTTPRVLPIGCSCGCES